MYIKLFIIVFCYCLFSMGFFEAHAILPYNDCYKQNFRVALKQSNDSPETFLKDSAINTINSLDENEALKKEIDRLNKDLDSLQTNLAKLQTENSVLKSTLKDYQGKYNVNLQRASLIDSVSKEARESKAYYDSLKAPDLYLSALNLLIIGNLSAASTQLADFISKSSEEIKKSQKVDLSTNQNFFMSYANYWLGKIENINGDYTKAVENFSESYKITTNTKISLIALVGLIESLSKLYKDAEACIVIKQFNDDYTEFLKDSKTQLDKSYLEIVSKYSSINKC